MKLVKDNNLFYSNCNSISYKIKFKPIAVDWVKRIQIKLEVQALQQLVRLIIRMHFNFKVWETKKEQNKVQLLQINNKCF